MIYDGITELVGRTPLMRLNRYMARHSLKAEILAKLEYLNPAGSVKDRVALKWWRTPRRRDSLKRAAP